MRAGGQEDRPGRWRAGRWQVTGQATPVWHVTTPARAPLPSPAVHRLLHFEPCNRDLRHWERWPHALLPRCGHAGDQGRGGGRPRAPDPGAGQGRRGGEDGVRRVPGVHWWVPWGQGGQGGSFLQSQLNQGRGSGGEQGRVGVRCARGDGTGRAGVRVHHSGASDRVCDGYGAAPTPGLPKAIRAAERP
mgnify:CR=1 FL=1